MGADMAFILLLLMALVPLYLGKGALHLLYGNQPTQDMSPADEVLTGYMLVIGLAEAAHLAGCILGRSFSDCVILFLTLLATCLFGVTVLLLIVRKHKKEDPTLRRKAEQERTKKALQEGITGRQQLLSAVFGVLVLLQLITVFVAKNPYLDGDMTRETVNSFLVTDAVYQVNPMTGQAYTLGMPLRLKILCLPTFYGILCRCFGLHVDMVVLRVVPALVLLGSYLAYSTVTKRLFPRKREARVVFLIAVALLFGMGDYMPAMDGFGMMHSGFRGVTIRAAILIPYTFGLMLRKKYKLVMLCILAEACMVWTLYGLGACAAVAAGMLFFEFVYGRYTGQKGREEADLC